MTAASAPIGIGLIGCGGVAEGQHLPALQSLAGVKVVAAADVDQARLDHIASRFQIERLSTDFNAVLDNRAVNVVAVCVPASAHVKVALAALDAGKHVLVEKPLALDLDEIDRLIEKASQSSLKVLVGFNLRRHRLVRDARNIVQQGTLGRLEMIRTVLTSNHDNVPNWRRRRDSGGGGLIELAVHHYDLWRFLLKSEVEEVFAMTRSSEWDDETATVTARMADGVIAVSEVCERTTSNSVVEVNGREGRVRVNLYVFDGLEYSPPANVPGDMRVRLRKIRHALKELPGALGRRGGDFPATYAAEWRHFVDSINHGTAVDCTLEDGRRATQIMLAAVESRSRGRPVKVAEAPRRITSSVS